jgi:hypothetical protein
MTANIIANAAGAAIAFARPDLKVLPDLPEKKVPRH